ncbi:unnamed protein product [Polarella glacialis]|uniref:Uncharacterized protein n=1 Tax=Polarella glacialis TaxID=89957 RepID=A0A813FNP2_POLGL|nr:unnamed protein product [Polarella glacialis]CAE8613759.1 unnamed protein product [Polarella glacialis]CAE8613760.1 unnamed protein product [Polarella glacialis]CAE8613761.1 unnamed protein product [Polarella glacialis]CAE8684422.1 unnamed protein product [Polarella glacialis]
MATWKKGLFECDIMRAFTTYLCGPCTIAEIHMLAKPDFLGLSKCMACCLPIKPCQLYVYGQELANKGGFKESCMNGVLKIWCCGLCYTMQQYNEALGGSEGKGCGELLSTCSK